MKKWNEAEIVELNIAETAGGYISGDKENVFTDGQGDSDVTFGDVVEGVLEFIGDMFNKNNNNNNNEGSQTPDTLS